MTLCIIHAWWILCQHLCLSLPHQLLLLFSFDFFCHLFKMFLFSFLFNFVWNILCQHLGLFLPLIILLSISIPFFLFRFFSSFTWCILCHIFLLGVYYANTWVPHAIYFLSATLYYHDIHTVTFYLLYEVICIHCNFTLFSLQISTSFYLLFIVSFFTWYLSCQHLGPTCHLLSLRHFIWPWHSHRHFIFTLWSHLYKHHIHCKFTLFTLFINTFYIHVISHLYSLYIHTLHIYIRYIHFVFTILKYFHFMWFFHFQFPLYCRSVYAFTSSSFLWHERVM